MSSEQTFVPYFTLSVVLLNAFTRQEGKRIDYTRQLEYQIQGRLYHTISLLNRLRINTTYSRKRGYDCELARETPNSNYKRYLFADY